jgi:hypothetical protein
MRRVIPSRPTDFSACTRGERGVTFRRSGACSSRDEPGTPAGLEVDLLADGRGQGRDGFPDHLHELAACGQRRALGHGTVDDNVVIAALAGAMQDLLGLATRVNRVDPQSRRGREAFEEAKPDERADDRRGDGQHGRGIAEDCFETLHGIISLAVHRTSPISFWSELARILPPNMLAKIQAA